MGRGMKIVLALILLAMIAACLWAVNPGFVFLRWLSRDLSKHMLSDPSLTTDIAARFVKFDLPAGYTPRSVGQSLGVFFVSFERDDGRGYIEFHFYEDPAGRSDWSPLERRVWHVFEQYLREYSGGQPVGEIQRTIRGQSVTLWQGQGTTEDVLPMRVMIGSFWGARGPVMLWMSRTINDWNGDEVDAFLASIR